MTNDETNTPKEVQVWKRYVQTYNEYIQAFYAFSNLEMDRASVIKDALQKWEERNAILSILKTLKITELQEIFAELVYLCSWGSGYVGTVREAVLKIPKEWLIAHIEEAAEPILMGGDYDNYRRMLELYREIDQELTEKLAQRAAASEDEDIQEAGLEFLEYLKISNDARENA